MKITLRILTAMFCLLPVLYGQSDPTFSKLFQTFKQVTTPGDGILFGTTVDNHIYMWTGSEWKQVEGELAQVSVGSKEEIWGVSASNEVWKVTPSGWQRQPGLMRQVAVAKGGGAVVAVDLQGRPVVWNGASWTPLPNAPVLTEIAMGKPGKIVGTTATGDAYRWKPTLNRWVPIKGAKLHKITVGVDGSVGGLNPDNIGVIRTEADIEAVENGSQATPAYVYVEVKAASFDLITVSTSMIVGVDGLLIQRQAVAPNIVIDAQLVATPIEPYAEAPAFVFNTGNDYNPERTSASTNGGVTVKVKNSVVLCPTLKLDQDPANCITVGTGNKATFKSVQNPASKSVYTEKVAANQISTMFNIPAAGTSSTSYVARASSSAALPVLCDAKHVRDQSKHTWAEFRLPLGVEGQAVLIPAGAYNKYVFPACNRVWWDNLAFVCTRGSNGWKQVYGRFDADAACHGTVTPSPYLAVGDR